MKSKYARVPYPQSCSVKNTWASPFLTDGTFTWSLISFEFFFTFPQFYPNVIFLCCTALY